MLALSKELFLKIYPTKAPLIFTNQTPNAFIEATGVLYLNEE